MFSDTESGNEPDALFLRFKATKSEPDYARIFMELGGSIGAAASNWETDLSVTGSEFASVTTLDQHELREVSIKLPRSKWKLLKATESTPECVLLPAEMRLNVSTSRMAAAINGTLVSSVSGQGSEFVFNMLSPRGHTQVGLVYKSWMAHAASLGISDARVVSLDENDGERVHLVGFEKRPEQLSKILSAAAQVVNAYVEQAWTFRKNVVYKASPMLTKTVFKETVGVDGQGYSLLHDISERGSPVSLKTLDSLFKAAIETDCLHDKKDISYFLSCTSNPGLAAASQARVVASATSMIVNFMISYRADGRNFISTKGADFAQAESWQRQLTRNAIEANDCDGSALFAVGILNAARNMTAEQLAAPGLEYLKAVRNTIHPYYEVGVSVLGATAGEASSLGDKKTESVAGHAIAVILPILSFLKSLKKSMRMSYGPEKTPLNDPNTIDAVENARFAAIFTNDVKSALPSHEQTMLSSWKTAQAEFDNVFQPFAIEGTTPASSTLYTQNASHRADAEKDARNDDIAFAKASPNVFRSIKVLHVGGSAAGSTHRFYRDLVEVTFPRSTPLYTDQNLRGMTAAASQYVLSRDTSADTLQFAGATPKDLVEESYIAAPMVSVGAQIAEVLDMASITAGEDVVARRPDGPMILTKFQTESLKQSMEYIRKMTLDLESRPDNGRGHSVAYISAYSTLVHNPKGVQQFCKTISGIATCGIADISLVEDLAVTHTGDQAGYFVTVNVSVPV